MSTHAFISVKAPVDAIRATLISFGATPHSDQSVVFDLGEDLIVLANDKRHSRTTLVIGGPDAIETGRWLAGQLEDLGWKEDS